MPEQHTQPTDNLLEKIKKKAETLDSERLGSLKLLAPLLQVVFSHLNHMQIAYDGDLAAAFAVTTIEQEKKDFTRRLFTSPNTSTSAATFIETGPVTLPEFSVQISIGASFSVVTNLPSLIKTVEQLHNQQMEDYGESNPMLFLNTSEQLADYWQFMAKRLREFVEREAKIINLIEQRAIANYQTKEATDEKKIKRHMYGPLNLSSTLQAYAELCQLIGEGFTQAASTTHQKTSLESLAQSVDNSAVFNLAWEKTEEALILTINKLLNRSETESERNTAKSKPQQLYDLLHRALGVIGGKAQEQIISTLNTQARDVFFHHCQAELYRKVGIGQWMQRYEKMDQKKEPSSVIKQKGKISQWFIDFVKDEFPQEQTELDNLKTKLQQAKQEYSKQDPSNRGTETDKLTQLQIEMANKLCAIVYSEKFIAYKAANFSFSNAIEENFANCMVRADLLSQLWREYTGETGLGATKYVHYFFVVKLADDKYMALDFKPQYFNPQSTIYYDLSSHEQLYQAAMSSWKAGELAKNPATHQQAETLFREAIRLSPNNPDFKNNLASLLDKYPERHPEAEALYKEAIRLSPTDPWPVTALADFYHHQAAHIESTRKTELAREYYRQALQIMTTNPSAPNWLTEADINFRIERL